MVLTSTPTSATINHLLCSQGSRITIYLTIEFLFKAPSVDLLDPFERSSIDEGIHPWSSLEESILQDLELAIAKVKKLTENYNCGNCLISIIIFANFFLFA